ncbi:2,3-diaminopropionate biosynthesis protein SbnA [Actinoplanes sp. CA-054009]
MPIFDHPEDLVLDDVYLNLRTSAGLPLHLKIEAFNLSGSIKVKTAVGLVDDAHRNGLLPTGSTIIESSSGNLGVALAMVAASRGYRFICVTDPHANPACADAIRAFGGEVVVVNRRDTAGGYLGTRIAEVKRRCAESDGDLVWLNQYDTAANADAHYATTAAHVFQAFPNLDYLFVGSGTTGTVMGCARYARDHGKRTKVIAVDPHGSVTFGGPPGHRLIPGIGTSRQPGILDATLLDDVVVCQEADAVGMCRWLARRGILVGGSTGSVVASANAYLSRLGDRSSTAVALSPDLGDHYLGTVFNDSWCRQHALSTESGPRTQHSDEPLAGALAPGGK